MSDDPQFRAWFYELQAKDRKRDEYTLEQEKQIKSLKSDNEALRKALGKIKHKAGNHTVAAGPADESDHGFKGIWAVANNALSPKAKP